MKNKFLIFQYVENIYQCIILYFQLVICALVSIIGIRLSSRHGVAVVQGRISQTSLGDIIMDHLTVQSTSDSPAASTHGRSSTESPVPATTHPVLSRLMEEVRNESRVEVAYDRVHNRHNRGR